MPPPNNPPPQSPKFRVLPPDLAKLRRGALPRSKLTSNPQPQSQSPSASQPQPQAQKRPSFFAHLRNTYASLPRPYRTTFRFMGTLLPLVPIGLFFSEHVLQVMWVRGPSMTPYLNEDYENMQTKSDVVLVNMWGGGGVWPWERRRRLERGMVVTFRSPANPRHMAIKRIIGLPGDQITTRQPCMKETQIVPYNHVWLEGDAQDPKKTMDSNSYGPVSISLITGRVMAVLHPRWRWLDWSDWENGVVEGDVERRFGEDYRQEVRDRVLKEAVKLERPFLE
ncbi:putative mitochondrial inner membrane protease subunit Imp2 [Aspergillus ibericus CBS 121593]|uniref:Mitochondrial inner membrane protease subunit 2 n=1 Tax=Aspergillus ibericus CBS 121593 TaxID=1448316 RepID=A0A395GU67_9EURO|nr:LexA/Signal peptidase [Aspergillus ibericus CBS 121593]RAK98217.1 LexA/Signal peptidase [Aspergillus ibericus CBS 121593]